MERRAQVFSKVPAADFCNEAETEAMGYLQRTYGLSPALTVDEAIDLFKELQDKRPAVVACVVWIIFEEFKHLSHYPEDELILTAKLLGSIVQHGLVVETALGLALRFVLEAVAKPTCGKQLRFGIAAVDRFKYRLKEFPQYCQAIASSSNFKSFSTELVPWVDCGARGHSPPEP